MNVSAWSIKNPIAGVMLFVMLTFAGILSFNAMKVQQFPDLDLPTIVVVASLPGAAPAQMETEVARKLENSIATLEGLKHIYSKVQDGGVTVTAEFRLEKSGQEALDDLFSLLEQPPDPPLAGVPLPPGQRSTSVGPTSASQWR